MSTSFKEIYLAGQVTRYHANPFLNRACQTNADHSWGVAMACIHFHPNPSRALLKAAMIHDLGEKKVGDLPAPFKNENPDFAKAHAKIETEALIELTGGDAPCLLLNPSDAKFLKIMDRLESILFICLFAQDAKEFDGLADQVDRISAVVSDFDFDLYSQLDAEINPILEAKAGLSITPF